MPAAVVDSKSGARPNRARWILLGVAGALFLVALGVTQRDRVVAGVRDRIKMHGVQAHLGLIEASSAEFGLDPYLVAGVMFHESGGEVDAVSRADALGLLQLKLSTARERAAVLGLDEPSRHDLLSDAELNVRLGCAYLAYLMNRYHGEVEAALSAFNTGPTRLDGWIAEHGGFDAWRTKQVADGDSQVYNYARSCIRYGEVFRARGWFEGPDA